MNVRRLISTIIATIFVISLVIPSVTPSSTSAESEKSAEGPSQVSMSLHHWGVALQKYARGLVTFTDHKIQYLRQIDEPAMPCQTEELTVSSATIMSTTISSIKPVSANGAAFSESGKSIEGETCVACY